MNQLAQKNLDNVDVWQQICTELKKRIGNATYNSWINPLKLVSLENHELQLSAPTKFIADWVETHFYPKIRALSPVEIRTISISIGGLNEQTPPASEAVEVAPETKVINIDNYNEAISSRIDKRYRFDNFITASSNDIAFAAAKKVAEKGGDAGFNPLFLHAGVGLGKTHLLHAIANYNLDNNTGRKVLYLSAEKFLHCFIRSLRDKKILEFKEELRSADILMIDDFQFICGKESTQQEFFHTFNALVDSGKQLVISCDRAPSEFTELEERMRSRLASGLVMDIEKTDYNLRLQILKSKTAEHEAQISDEILEFMAEKITSNVRELEGALNRITARTSLVSRQIDIDSAKNWIADLLKVKTKDISIQEIQKEVAAEFNINLSDMVSSSRAKQIARPRQIAMYLAKKLTTSSLMEIGKMFGGKDHTTVMHACKKIDELQREDLGFMNSIETLTAKLKSC